MAHAASLAPCIDYDAHQSSAVVLALWLMTYYGCAVHSACVWLVKMLYRTRTAFELSKFCFGFR